MVTWILAFIIAEVIPFFSDRKFPTASVLFMFCTNQSLACCTCANIGVVLSLMSSLFDSFFGFIFWGVAYFRMRKADGRLALVKQGNIYAILMAILNLFIILIGLFFLTAGTYASVQSIVDAFNSNQVGGVFTCATNGL